MAGWPNLSDLIVGVESKAPVGLVGAPLAAGSVTAGQCDLAPALLRQTLRRIGRYDVETQEELDSRIAVAQSLARLAHVEMGVERDQSDLVERQA